MRKIFNAVVLAGLALLTTTPLHSLSLFESHIRLPGNAPPKGLFVLLTPLDGQRLSETPRPLHLHLRSSGFEQTLLAARVPTRLILNNEGERTHNIYCPTPEHPFDFGLIGHDPVGKSLVLQSPARLDLHCSIYPIAPATILLVQGCEPLAVDAQGKFSLENLASGRWLLNTWQREKRFRNIEQEITLPLTAPLTLKLKR